MSVCICVVNFFFNSIFIRFNALTIKTKKQVDHSLLFFCSLFEQYEFNITWIYILCFEPKLEWLSSYLDKLLLDNWLLEIILLESPLLPSKISLFPLAWNHKTKKLSNKILEQLLKINSMKENDFFNFLLATYRT